MREVTVSVFQFGELSAKAKEVARDWYRDCIDNSDYQTTEENIAEVSGMLGFDADLQWSGFGSQGDGACLVGTWSAASCCFDQFKKEWPNDKELNRISLELQAIVADDKEATATLTHSGCYSHCYSVMIDFDSIVYTDKDRFIDAARDLMKWAYAMLENQNEYLYSADYIDETIEANEYDFTEDGERWTRHGR